MTQKMSKYVLKRDDRENEYLSETEGIYSSNLDSAKKFRSVMKADQYRRQHNLKGFSIVPYDSVSNK